jgi:hypothetical protein
MGVPQGAQARTQRREFVGRGFSRDMKRGELRGFSP